MEAGHDVECRTAEKRQWLMQLQNPPWNCKLYWLASYWTDVVSFVRVTGLPALLCGGIQYGDFLGGLFAFIAIISMVELQFSIGDKPKKASKK